MFRKKGDLKLFSFDSFEGSGSPIQAMSTRIGGVSEGPYWSLNLGLHVNDEDSAVLINRQRFFRALSIPPGSIVTGQQVHGTEVAVIKGSDRGKGARSWEEGIPHTDALVTDSPDVALLVLVADCAAVLFYDHVKRAIGIAHGSWRGTVGGIGRKTVQKMVDAFGCRLEDIRAGICPSIGPCCYEVGEEVISALRGSYLSQWERYLIPRGNGSVHFDLWEALRQQLIEIGIQEEQIETAHICTACHTDLFYSHRRENGRTGRNGVVIALQKPVEKVLRHEKDGTG